MILGPPSEGGARTDLGLACGEVAASRADGVHEIIQRGDELVDDRLIHRGPQRLGGMELGFAGWTMDEPDAVRHATTGSGHPRKRCSGSATLR